MRAKITWQWLQSRGWTNPVQVIFFSLTPCVKYTWWQSCARDPGQRRVAVLRRLLHRRHSPSVESNQFRHIRLMHSLLFSDNKATIHVILLCTYFKVGSLENDPLSSNDPRVEAMNQIMEQFGHFGRGDELFSSLLSLRILHDNLDLLADLCDVVVVTTLTVVTHKKIPVFWSRSKRQTKAMVWRAGQVWIHTPAGVSQQSLWHTGATASLTKPTVRRSDSKWGQWSVIHKHKHWTFETIWSMKLKQWPSA